jgi:hypothetical protein
MSGGTVTASGAVTGEILPWLPLTNVTAGEQRRAPDSSLIVSGTTRITGAAYDAIEAPHWQVAVVDVSDLEAAVADLQDTDRRRSTTRQAGRCPTRASTAVTRAWTTPARSSTQTAPSFDRDRRRLTGRLWRSPARRSPSAVDRHRPATWSSTLVSPNFGIERLDRHPVLRPGRRDRCRSGVACRRRQRQPRNHPAPRRHGLMARATLIVADATTNRIPPSQVGGVPTWQPTTFYKQGEIVVDGTHIVQSNLDHTSGSGSRNTANWTELGPGVTTRTITSVSYAATITPALPTSGDLVLNVGALTGNVTIANPTGTPTDGQTMRLRLSQDATGGRTITWGSAYKFGSTVQTTDIPSAASAAFEMVLSYHAGSSQWRVLGIDAGF